MSQDKQMLQYYQQKIDELYKERLSWLSKFNQCNSQLHHKHQLMQQLQEHKDKEFSINRNIIHHDIALIDQNINLNKMERENIINQYNDAHQILKIQELLEQYPQTLEKHLPCSIFSHNNQIINNELNIHSKQSHGQAKSVQKSNIFRESNSVLNNSRFKEAKVKYKPSYEELMKRQINEIKTNQQKEIVLLNEQTKKLEGLIGRVKKEDKGNLQKQRHVVDELKKQTKKQEKKYKEISEKFFSAKKQIQEEHQATLKENQKLKSVLAKLQAKVNEEMRIYQKQNKAKQTLITRKSQDFQEDYKAKMRAKERNLQALRQNYEKMQQVCIQKIQKLEETLGQAKDNLRQTERRRQYLLNEFRNELNGLQIQLKVERTEKAKIDLQIKEKLQEDRRKRQMLQQKEQDDAKRFKKANLIEQAYRKPEKKVVKGKSKEKKGKVPGEQKAVRQKSESEDEDEFNMSELQNIREHINKLGKIIDPNTHKNK